MLQISEHAQSPILISYMKYRSDIQFSQDLISDLLRATTLNDNQVQGLLVIALCLGGSCWNHVPKFARKYQDTIERKQIHIVNMLFGKLNYVDWILDNIEYLDA